MVLSLAQVLNLDVFKRAKPQVAYGQRLLDRPVRWVHTSELVEAAALLQGGELLLTTGLGLAGRGPVAQHSYVEQLAAHGAAALVLELGWTFPEVPDDLLSAARRCQLPLVALREIVPFVELTEEVQSHILIGHVAELRARRRIDHVVEEHLGTGGLWGLIEATSVTTGCPTVLETTAGYPVAWAGLDAGDNPQDVLLSGELHTVDIEPFGKPWGALHVAGTPTATPEIVAAMLDRCRQMVTLALLSGRRQVLPLPIRQRHDFLEDLVVGRAHDQTALEARAAMIGFHIPAEGAAIGFALDVNGADNARISRHAAQAVASNHSGIAADVDGIVSGVITAPSPERTGLVAKRLLAEVDTVVTQQEADLRPRLAVGNPVTQVIDLGHTLRDARDALTLAANLGWHDRAITAASLDTDRVLAAVVDEPDAVELLRDRLGPLIDYDRRTGSELVHTLWVYLTRSSSKTAAAAALGIQRQTVHQRLDRMEQLLGQLDRPDDHFSLLLALSIYELRRRRQRDE